MRNQLKIVYSALTVVAMLGLTSTVHGVPSFARQTGLDCNSCHAAIGFPVLNTFGQAFKAGGFTQASDDTLMGDGEALSIPKTLNAAVVAKMRYHMSSTTSTGKVTSGGTAVSVTNPTGLKDMAATQAKPSSRTDLPDEWAIWLSGRAGKHIGFATEIGANTPTMAAKLTEQGGGAKAAEGFLAPVSFKMPIVYDIGPVKAGVVPFWTDAQGPGFGFETLSTGAVGNVKMFEGGGDQSARMYLEDRGGLNNGASAGLALYIWHPMGFINYTPFATSGLVNEVKDVKFAHYLRAAITPSLAGFDMALGFQLMTGNQGFDDGSGTDNSGIRARVNYFGIDAQVMGTIAIPVMLAVTWGATDDTVNTKGFNTPGAKASAWTVMANATVIEDLLNIGLGVRMASVDQYIADTTTAVTADQVTAGNLTPVLKKEVYFDGTNAIASTSAAAVGTRTDNQLIAEVKFNLARNVRLSLTGYLGLNAVEVADSKGIIKPTTVNSTGSAGGNSKEDRLLVMLFGGF